MRKSTITEFVASHTWQLFALLAFGLMPLVPAQAQPQSGQVAVPVTQQSPQWKNIPKPHFGQSEKQVRAQFGAPEQIKPPKGKPSITRWVYPRFTVYLEAGRVIDTVLNHKKGGH